jgi:S1-C subfamily serine protease
MAVAVKRLAAALVAASLGAAPAARAENQMGYQLLSAQQAAQLPRGGGTLGMQVGRGEVIADSGMTFELMKVQAVRRGSPAARAGLNVGDQVIAVDGQVFSSVVAFAGFVGSLPPGRTISVDYLPRGGGPEQAQRVGVTLSNAGRGGPAPGPEGPEPHGLSTGQKLAIGAGAVALFGCYKMGCFSHRDQPQQPGGASYQR